MQQYDPKQIEIKWQKYWETKQTFVTPDKSKKEKFYALIEFPYPSGQGLHVGHPRPFTAMDVVARKKRMEGYNVLYPIGFDAFGLPTENYAIKTGRPPAEVTAENIITFTSQLKMLGYSFDWSRVVDTTDPKYFKWTQWLFLKFFEHGLAYKKEMPINWCLSCKIGLANEEVVDGKCERCGGEVEKRNKSQWMFAITKYAEKLLEGLKDVDYIKQAKIQQENWIGRSEGATVCFAVILNGAKRNEESLKQEKGSFAIAQDDKVIEVFTTRPDTLFGATYMVVAPEHEIIKNLKSKIKNFTEVEKYIKEAKNKSELERTKEWEKVPTQGRDARFSNQIEDLEKIGKKTGVELQGIKAVNPVNNEEIPIFVADYVLTGYGTGAIMAVPAHDERDFEFAKKYDLPIKEVVQGDVENDCFSGEGTAINSDFLNGLSTLEAKEKIIQYLEEKNIGKRKVQYKLRDWVFSRQRYWGEPIPLVYCQKCDWIPLPESELPLELPKVDKYEPTDTGESPLAVMEDWVNTICPKCGGPAKRETDTMPNWAGSSWYFLRYVDSHNDKEFASMDKLKNWLPVDWYNGGMEHTVLHLLYSRFWNQFLYDIGLVPNKEPYLKRTSHGMILAEDGEKMSKSRGNVINPDEMVAKFGADAVRTYIMFMGPFDQAVAWDTNGLVGVRRFLDRVWNLQVKLTDDKIVDNFLHKTIKKVGKDIDKMHFNTAIAIMMELTNEYTKAEKVSQDSLTKFVKILSPFAPHICEELWSKLGNKDSLAYEPWPEYDAKLIIDEIITVAVQVNGKLRDILQVPVDISEADVKKLALDSNKVQKWLAGKEPKKVIYVKGKIVSIVV